MIQQITSNWVYVGASNHRLKLFENIYPLSRGMSYNSYLLLDQKTVLMDTCDDSVRTDFLENVVEALKDRPLDYLIVQHMEPDHAALLNDILQKYPQTKIVCTSKSVQILYQFFNWNNDKNIIVVAEGDTLNTGSHNLRFIMTPMVHWPEVMMTYDEFDKILFSADAFGSFNAIEGNLFASEVPYQTEWLPDNRRYYANIVGKYGMPVQNVLQKASKLDINIICPLHGLIWKEKLNWLLDKYEQWSSYTPEEKAIVIVYASIYGNTERFAQQLAFKFAQKGIYNIRMYDASKTDPSWIVSESFRASHLVFASSSYNAGLFTPMETVLSELKAHALSNRTIGLVENGTWACSAGKEMKKIIETMKNIHLVDPTITLKSTFKTSQSKEVDAFIDNFLKDF